MDRDEKRYRKAMLRTWQAERLDCEIVKVQPMSYDTYWTWRRAHFWYLAWQGAVNKYYCLHYAKAR